MKKLSLVCLLGGLLAVTFLLSGCKSKAQPEDLRPVPEALNDPNGGAFGRGGEFGNAAGAGNWGNTDSVVNQAANGDVDADGWRDADPTGNNLGMPVIYFAYDSDQLVPSETANLDKIAEYMQRSENGSLGLLIQGHCDQRGTEEYNRALGERRANAIRAYLAGRGVADARLKTISFGKDKPAVEGSGPQVWAKNRRGVPVPKIIPQH